MPLVESQRACRNAQLRARQRSGVFSGPVTAGDSERMACIASGRLVRKHRAFSHPHRRLSRVAPKWRFAAAGWAPLGKLHVALVALS